MGLLGGLLHRKPSQREDDSAINNFASQQIFTRNQSSAQEAEDRQNKGIDIDMIDPQEIISELQSLAHYEYTVKVNKLITNMVNGVPSSYVAVVDENRIGTRAWAIAVLGYLNKVWPTIWMSSDEADTTWLGVRVAFHDIRKCMSYEEKKKYGIILRMSRDLCLARCEDMKDGHKALLLKVRREELGVHMSRGNDKIGGK
jgi:hypothetical protein